MAFFAKIFFKVDMFCQHYLQHSFDVILISLFLRFADNLFLSLIDFSRFLFLYLNATQQNLLNLFSTENVTRCFRVNNYLLGVCPHRYLSNEFHLLICRPNLFQNAHNKVKQKGEQPVKLK